MDSQPSQIKLIIWFTKHSRVEKAREFEALQRVIQLLGLYADLRAAISHARLTDPRLVENMHVECQLLFGMLQPQWKISDAQVKGMEEVFLRAKAEAMIASAEQLSSIAAEVRQKAIDLLKLFAESLTP